MDSNIDLSNKEEACRGSITAFGLRNAAEALEELLEMMEKTLTASPQVITGMKAAGILDQFNDEHRQVKLVPGLLFNLADAMDAESENPDGDGQVILVLKVNKDEVATREQETTTLKDDLKKKIDEFFANLSDKNSFNS